MVTGPQMDEARMSAAAFHAQWHHAIHFFAGEHPLAGWVDLLGWRVNELVAMGQGESAAALQGRLPEIQTLWQSMHAEARIQIARAEGGDIIYQPHPPIDPLDTAGVRSAAREHLARMRGDAPGYQALLDSIRRFSAAIIPAWQSMPGHEDRPFVEELIQFETIAADALGSWLTSLDRLGALLSSPQHHPSMIQHRYCATLHQVLANPDLTDRLPRIGQCRTLEEFQSHWETLFYLMGALLGWASPAAGLAWWYAGGRQSHGDPRLDLIHSVWDDEGQLDSLAAHCWRGNSAFMHPDELSPAEIAVTSPWRDEDWWRAFKRRGRRFPHDPFYGGTNPLHLDLFACGRADPPDGSVQLIVHPVQPRRATLIVEDFSSWRAALERFGNSLPEDPHHSWHVDVFHNPGGYLGLFRRSRVTGRWFQGKHHIHLAGNPPES